MVVGRVRRGRSAAAPAAPDPPSADRDRPAPRGSRPCRARRDVVQRVDLAVLISNTAGRSARHQRPGPSALCRAVVAAAGDPGCGGRPTTDHRRRRRALRRADCRTRRRPPRRSRRSSRPSPSSGEPSRSGFTPGAPARDRSRAATSVGSPPEDTSPNRSQMRMSSIGDRHVVDLHREAVQEHRETAADVRPDGVATPRVLEQPARDRAPRDLVARSFADRARPGSAAG